MLIQKKEFVFSIVTLAVILAAILYDKLEEYMEEE